MEFTKVGKAGALPRVYLRPKTNMPAVLIEPHYLPSLEYFSAISNCESIVFEVHEHFVKQTPRTRTTILTAAGPKTLVVPVVHGGLGRMPLWQVEIDYSTRWWVNHWRTIDSAYRNAPWFEHFADGFQNILLSREKLLVNLNKQLIQLCLEILRWKADFRETTEFSATTSLIDLRNLITDKAPFQSRSLYRPEAYNQVFGGIFTPNMSVLDAIYCCGPEAGRIIAKSVKAVKNEGDQSGAVN